MDCMMTSFRHREELSSLLMACVLVLQVYILSQQVESLDTLKYSVISFSPAQIIGLFFLDGWDGNDTIPLTSAYVLCYPVLRSTSLS
jgi:hypothetical protein